MDTHVIGIRGADEMHAKKVAAAKALAAAGIEMLPPELAQYFGTKYSTEVTDDTGIVLAERNETIPGVSYWSDEGREGYEVEISKLPAGVVRLRFYNSW